MREPSTDLLHAMQARSQLGHAPPLGMAANRPEIKKAARGDFDYRVISALLVEVRRELSTDLLHAMQAR